MNQVALIGRLARKPELRQVGQEQSVVNFTLAVDNRGEDAHFIDCEAWGKTAESLAEYQDQGDEIGVSGRIKQDRWEKDGQKRSKLVVVAERIDFLRKKGSGKDAPESVESVGF